MCNKCKPSEHKKYWVHIADSFTEKEKQEMSAYLNKTVELPASQKNLSSSSDSKKEKES